jgi:hypothetical protein
VQATRNKRRLHSFERRGRRNPYADQDIAAIHTKQAAYRSYCIAVAMREAPAVLAWDMDDPYHYARLGTDASTQQPMLIVGGEDHRVGQNPSCSGCRTHFLWLRRPREGKQRPRKAWFLRAPQGALLDRERSNKGNPTPSADRGAT